MSDIVDAVKSLKHVKSIGLELEGGVCENGLEKFLDKHTTAYLGYDGSVRVNRSARAECSYWISDAEIKIWYPVSEFDKLADAVAELFDAYNFTQNETCGNHIHLKLSDEALTAILLYPEVAYRMFMREYLKMAREVMNEDEYLGERLMSRLRNRYCKKFKNVYDLYDNTMGCGDRYRAVNFSSVYRHKDVRTVEVRVFPYAEKPSEIIFFAYFASTTFEKIAEKLINLSRIVIEEETFEDLEAYPPVAVMMGEE